MKKIRIDGECFYDFGGGRLLKIDEEWEKRYAELRSQLMIDFDCSKKRDRKSDHVRSAINSICFVYIDWQDSNIATDGVVRDPDLCSEIVIECMNNDMDITKSSLLKEMIIETELARLNREPFSKGFPEDSPIATHMQKLSKWRKKNKENRKRDAGMRVFALLYAPHHLRATQNATDDELKQINLYNPHKTKGELIKEISAKYGLSEKTVRTELLGFEKSSSLAPLVNLAKSPPTFTKKNMNNVCVRHKKRK